MTVAVIEPKDSFSSHKEPFTAIIVEARVDCVSVRSFNDKLFNIDLTGYLAFRRFKRETLT